MNVTEDINATLVECSREIVESLLLSQNQRIILTVFNTLSILGNIVANSLVVYVLIKTKQIRNITCKLIFVISVSDTMQGMFVQNLYTAYLFENLCSALYLFITISIFFCTYQCIQLAYLALIVILESNSR